MHIKDDKHGTGTRRLPIPEGSCTVRSVRHPHYHSLSNTSSECKHKYQIQSDMQDTQATLTADILNPPAGPALGTGDPKINPILFLPLRSSQSKGAQTF